MSTARNYLDLTKPRLLPMVLFTGLPVLGMAAGGWLGTTFAVKKGERAIRIILILALLGMAIRLLTM